MESHYSSQILQLNRCFLPPGVPWVNVSSVIMPICYFCGREFKYACDIELLVRRGQKLQ